MVARIRRQRSAVAANKCGNSVPHLPIHHFENWTNGPIHHSRQGYHLSVFQDQFDSDDPFVSLNSVTCLILLTQPQAHAPAEQSYRFRLIYLKDSNISGDRLNDGKRLFFHIIHPLATSGVNDRRQDNVLTWQGYFVFYASAIQSFVRQCLFFRAHGNGKRS